MDKTSAYRRPMLNMEFGVRKHASVAPITSLDADRP